MAAQEHRRVINQGGILTTERDRALAVAIRRTLLMLVVMIEDHYGIEPINQKRKEERADRLAR